MGSLSLNDKIIAAMKSAGIENATMRGTILVIPHDNGEMLRNMEGVVTARRLQDVIAEYKVITGHA